MRGVSQGLRLIAGLVGLFVVPYKAYCGIDQNAAVVEVRTSCVDNGIIRNNCFTSLTALMSWLENIRLPKPSATAPLHVEIGPGVFRAFNMSCNPSNGYTGYVSFEGAGVRQTTIESDDFSSPVNIYGCTELSFSNLSINGKLYGGVVWNGGGDSTWNNVHVSGFGNTWYSIQCGSSPGNHYWTASRITSFPVFSLANAYVESCDTSWFFGSEITVNVPSNSDPSSGGAVVAYGRGEIHVYGSVLRAMVDGPTIPANPVVAAAVGALGDPNISGGNIHIHGTGIDVVSNTGMNVTALYASAGGEIHANQTSYFLKTAGQKTRIYNSGGHVHAPYHWEQHENPPAVISVKGADTAVVTSTADGHPRMVIYDDSCPSRWYDMVAASCR